MKKTNTTLLCSILVLITALLSFVGCSDMMDKLGNISLTIVLDTPEVEVASFSLEGLHANTATRFALNDITPPRQALSALKEGTWNLTVTAFDEDGDQLGIGTKNVDLKEGQIVETTLLVVFNQAVPTLNGFTLSPPSRYDSADGEITGTTSTMEYKLASSSEESPYIACTEGITILGAGTYLVRYAPAHGLNASEPISVTVPSYQPIQVTVGSPTLTATNKTYDGTTAIAGTVTAGSLNGVQGSDEVTVHAVASYDTATAGSDKTITVTYTLGGADAGNYIKPVDTTLAATIGKKQLTISGTTIAATKVYDRSTATAVTSPGTLGGVFGSDLVGVTATATYNDSTVGTDKPITIVYTLQGGDAGNYLKPVDNTAFTAAIVKKPLTVSGTTTSSTKQYDGGTSALVTDSGNLIGVVLGDAVTVQAAASYADSTIASGKPVTVSYTLGGSDAHEYQAPPDDPSYTGDITKKQLSIASLMLIADKTYDGATTAVVSSATLSGMVVGEDVSVSAVASYDSAAAGTDKTISIVYTLSGTEKDNYLKPGDSSAAGTITRKQLAVSDTSISTTKVYDGSTAIEVVTPGTLAGIIAGDTVTLHATANYHTNSAQTGKPITVTYVLGGSGASNYLKPGDNTSGTGQITRKTLTVSGTSISTTKVYDGSTTAEVVTPGTLTGIITGDSLTIDTVVAVYASAAVGQDKELSVSYTITGDDAGNYLVNSDTSKTASITKAVLTATVGDYSKTYGAVNPAFTVTVAGFVNGETTANASGYAAPTASSTATTTTGTGTSTIAIAGGSATNYSFNTTDTGTLTINKAVLTATVDDYSKTYGAANPAFTVAVVGFVNSESIANASGYGAPIASSAATTTTGVGTSTITITGGSATNYSFNTTDTGTLTINKAVLTATVGDYSKTYGAVNPAFSVSVAGFVNGESAANASGYAAPTASSTATTTTGVGTSTITIAGGSATNYSFDTSDTSSLTINKAVLTATVGDHSKTYGAANPSFSVSVAGFVNGESAANANGYVAPTASSTATTTTGVGTSTISITGGSATNYSFDTSDTGTLTITKAVLTATVGDYSKTYGAANPAFSVSVAGFVNGESAANANGYVAPTASSTATTTTGVGTSTISITGGSATNYSFNTSDTGTLTINKATMAGSVSISGIAQKDEVLTAVPSLTNTGTPTYQWKRGGTAISGATSTTYTLVSADIGFTITVTATASGANYQGSITSPAVGPVQKPAGPSMSDTITGYFPASPASPTMVNFTGFTTNLTNIEASVALNGSTYGDYANIEVDSRNRAMLVPASNVTTATKVRLRVKETTTLAAGPAQEIALTAQALAIGDYYQGGVVAYFFVSWDPGYIAGQVHGLIAAKSDVSPTKIAWSNSATTVVGTETGIGKGLANTNKIVTSLGGSAASYAAGMTRTYTGGGYTDWFLPSKEELYKMRISYNLIGNFATAAASYYWSSSEEQRYSREPTPYTGDTVNALEFTPNTSNIILVLQSWKTDTLLVRAVRYF